MVHVDKMLFFYRLSPDWKNILTNIKTKRTKPDDIKTTGAILQDFFATSFPSSVFETLLTPYYVAVWNGNLSHVIFLWSFVKEKNPLIGKIHMVSWFFPLKNSFHEIVSDIESAVIGLLSYP